LTCADEVFGKRSDRVDADPVPAEVPGEGDRQHEKGDLGDAVDRGRRERATGSLVDDPADTVSVLRGEAQLRMIGGLWALLRDDGATNSHHRSPLRLDNSIGSLRIEWIDRRCSK
jgi:hypothetical protein